MKRPSTAVVNRRVGDIGAEVTLSGDGLAGAYLGEGQATVLLRWAEGDAESVEFKLLDGSLLMLSAEPLGQVRVAIGVCTSCVHGNVAGRVGRSRLVAMLRRVQEVGS